MTVRAVTFDYWNTICVPDDRRFRTTRLDAIRDTLLELGVEVTHDDVVAAADGLVERFERHWRANEQFTAVEAVDHVLTELGAALPAHHVDSVAMAFSHAIEDPPPLAPNVADALRVLRDRDVRLGIVCDVGMTPSNVLRRYLDDHGLLELFDHWSFSDEVGVYKPHERIFEHALGGLGGIAPEEAAHIGDLRRTDVAGARALGIRAVRYRGVNDDDPAADETDDPVADADHVVDDHTELLDVLAPG